MTYGFCDHCDMPLAMCIHGNPPKVPERLGLIRQGPTIEATQYSDCVGCGEKIVPGQTITRSDEGWAHAREVEDPPNQSNIFDGIV